MNKFPAIPIGSRRELFWDEFLIDTSRTTASLKMHRPQAREVVMVHDEPWEGDGCDFHNILKDGDRYRMYYLAWRMLDPDATEHTTGQRVVAYAESSDGLNWIKPQLGLCERNGSKDNNIILDENTLAFDNFYVFKDGNPDCPPEEFYKAVAYDSGARVLRCFTSEDGIRFEKGWPITDRGRFDTLNVAFWDRHSGRYLCYVRDFHKASGEGFSQAESLTDGIRDIRWLESRDFKEWSVPQRLNFGDGHDFPLYTNVVQPYYRADHVFVGFPSRYIERKAWSPNYDDLPAPELRRKLVGIHPRYGLTVTDCVFMSSRDGQSWKRWDEAFMTPGPEREVNWVYGDCYPAVGMIETPSPLPGAPMELSMYAFDNHWSQRPAELRRHAIRIDGFVSYTAPYKVQKVITKPFVFDGDHLSINFATSAAGYIKIALKGENATLGSFELFGDSLNRRVVFEDGDLAFLAGKPVIMEIQMSDADIYSFKFTKGV